MASPDSKLQEARLLIVGFVDEVGQNDSSLDAWQRLCAILDLPDELPSITKCKKEISFVHFNLYNLLRHIQNPAVPLRRFKNYEDLRAYTNKKSGRRFPKIVAKENNLVKALLRTLA
ncbi:hypothetical protein BS50DRAFT_582997 [Corynespora cassiicola Philippines]|uniref:Uncharacterized protein n=1 Tax=Corynespora cassiicola Philippines TaxID=1448308 RepID=A0A2T2P6Z5_CORCC|nr:hypothetical protein BS50DRAFT_582997 [Corynespora cassiicola Philippines]